ncbi:4'-phosphopantetheinyl transferase family protein [Virgibacillus halodenitrificans]|uniref:4'-phosphopantetheinyl transferase family protein n=1 Tax=Virgibacillus halodenitrificans TaxID=1482 RepID=UPI000EF515E6|nr:4'-phosphopantetheinyl transferase superfamily protein [Virgibacillus halodenitrificans]
MRYLRFKEGEIDIDLIGLKFNSLSDDVIKQLIEFIPLEEKAKILKVRKRKDLQNSLIGKLMVRTIISYECKIPFDQTCILHTEYGRPILKLDNPPDFNVSHSENWVLVGFSHTGRIGVDIELIREIDPQTYPLYLNKREIDYVKETDSPSISNELWSIKESLIKLLGCGLSYAPDKMVIDINLYRRGEIKIENFISSNFEFHLSKALPGYIMCVCKDKSFKTPLNIREMKQSNFVNTFLEWMTHNDSNTQIMPNIKNWTTLV